MPEIFRMAVKELFLLKDGRTVLAGPIDAGERVIIEPGLGTVLVDGVKTATIQIEPELIASRAQPMERRAAHSISTRDATGLTREMVATKACEVEGTMRVYGHRHLMGIDSPPADFISDDLTLGPRLPEGWDGDAWMRPQEGGYFLRAWNKAAARYALGRGTTEAEAKAQLLEQIARGGQPVEIRVTETQGSRSS